MGNIHLPQPTVSRKFFAVLTLLLFTAWGAMAQSKTTERLEDRFPDSRAFFFYNNTLRMINQSEDPRFDAAIKDIEKMKFLMVNTRESPVDFHKIVEDYKSEAFEPIMTSRHEGRDFDIFLKEKKGKTTAMLVLVNDNTTLFVLDIVGRIDPGQVVKFFSVMDEKSDISKNIRAFVQRNDDDDEGDSTEADN
ncbi:MAG TPA: DUF4252 domain-containing protein [Cyclobacteriaceae bacterium]|nr:DUF4252 domain-containing protein [Cyclobacteriaceae bacterium]